MSKVAVVGCESYDYELVKKAVERGIELLGGAAKFAGTGDKVLLKPNLLTADLPERCSTTHFTVFKAVGEVMQQTGAELSYGDSPGFHSPEAAAKKNRIYQAAEELGIRLADFKNGEEVVFQEGRQNKKFTIAKGVLESNVMISLPKMKTHGFARMTGSIKNQFGCIPGALKGEFHVRIPDVISFCRMLVDLNLLLKPKLFIMDAVYAMEGNGPRGGTPRKVGAIILSEDPVALDTVVCKIMNLKPDYVPTINLGSEAGLGTSDLEKIELVGDPVESFIISDYNVERKPVQAFKQSGAFSFIKTALVPRPYIEQSKCVKCGVCANMCPVKPKALDWHDGDRENPPAYQYNRCIRCYCCQEMCPESAIKLKVPLARRLLTKKR